MSDTNCKMLAAAERQRDKKASVTADDNYQAEYCAFHSAAIQFWSCWALRREAGKALQGGLEN